MSFIGEKKMSNTKTKLSTLYTTRIVQSRAYFKSSRDFPGNKLKLRLRKAKCEGI